MPPHFSIDYYPTASSALSVGWTCLSSDFNDEDGEKLLNREGNGCNDVRNYITQSRKDDGSTGIQQQGGTYNFQFVVVIKPL